MPGTSSKRLQCILGIIINHTTVHSGYQYLFHHIAFWVSLLIIPLCSLNILIDHTTLDSVYPFQLHQIPFLMSSFYVLYLFWYLPFLDLLNIMLMYYYIYFHITYTIQPIYTFSFIYLFKSIYLLLCIYLYFVFPKFQAGGVWCTTESWPDPGQPEYGGWWRSARGRGWIPPGLTEHYL